MTPQKEDYLKVIYELGGDTRMVNNKEIGQALSVSAASVTEMSSKLLKEGYIVHIPYQGVRLSEKGQQVASQMIRKHRLWEVFLVDYLGFSWDEVHEEAEKLEHHSSDLLMNRLDRFLGFPKTDPHGGVIPDQDGKVMAALEAHLVELAVGTRFIIKEVEDESAFLKYLSQKEIRLQEQYQLEEVEAFDGPLTFRDREGRRYVLSAKAAAMVRVEKLEEA